MRKYLIRRLLLGIVTLIGGSVLIFVMVRVAPGDAAVMRVIGDEDGGGQTAYAKIEQIREEMGLNRPIAVQYVDWLGNFVTLDWGKSLWTKQKVADLLKRRYPVTLELALIAFIVAMAVAIPVGTLSAIKQDTAIDYILRTLSILGLAIPHFWMGIMIIFLMSAYLGWLPPLTYVAFPKDPIVNLQQLIIPALVISTATMAIATRMMRSATLEVMREDYIRTAYAKGLSSRLVLRRHAMKNALIPVITIAGVQLGHLVTGAVVTEVVFNLPGLGAALVDAVRIRDYPVVQTLVLLFTLGYILVNLAVDLLYPVLDPRVRYT